MKKIGIFYGSTTGTTEAVAEQIASHLGGGSSEVDRKSTRLNSSHYQQSRMPSSA